MTDPAWGFDTLQVHAGAAPDPATGARATPIYATAGYVFGGVGHAAASFRLGGLEQHAYSRLSNPTSVVAEQRIAALENGSAAVTVASGQAATTLALLNLLRSGDHVVASEHVYGGTVLLLRERFAELGIHTTFLSDVNSPAAWRAATRPNTRAFFAESIGNPTGVVLDIEAVAGVAHDHARVPLIVDNTLATPYLLRPLDHGADIVVHSTTKFLAGHGTAIGGVVVDGARFDFGAEPARWPGFHTPGPSHGDVGYWERFSPLGLAYALRLRTTVLRGYGPAPSPFNSFLLLQGLETLSLRMRQHVANARRIAEFLDGLPQVSRVLYPGPRSSSASCSASSAASLLAERYLPRGAGAVVSFVLSAGLSGGRRFVEAVRLFSHLANIGDVRSLIIHPASTVSSSLTEAQLAVSGITPGLIRLSVGIEDVTDLLADLERGFAAVTDA